MHDADAENDWMAGLDWSIHRRSSDAYQSDHLMLSGVAEMLARHVCAPFPEAPARFVALAGNTPPGPVVAVDRAFTEDGRPIHSMHARLSGLMRRHADDLSIGIASPDVVTRDEWDAVLEAGQIDWSLGQGARRAVAGIAPILAGMAHRGEIRCHARRRGGAPDTTPLKPSFWEVDFDTSVRRLAACGLNLASPFDQSAPVDHLIFVESGGLQNAVHEAARSHYVPITTLDHAPWDLRRRVDHYAVSVQEMSGYLASLMTDEHLAWTDADFRRAVSDRFPNLALGRLYERARAIATDHEDRRRFRVRRSAGA